MAKKMMAELQAIKQQEPWAGINNGIGTTYLNSPSNTMNYSASTLVRS